MRASGSEERRHLIQALQPAVARDGKREDGRKHDEKPRDEEHCGAEALEHIEFPPSCDLMQSVN